MERRTFDVVGIGALNIDLIAVGTNEVVEDGEFLAPRDEIVREFERRGVDYEAFLGGSAFNAVSMLADLRRPGVRIGFLGVSGAVLGGLSATHADRLGDLHVTFLGEHREKPAGTCGSFSSGSARELWVDPSANLDVVDVLNDQTLGSIEGARILHVSSLFDPPGSTAVTDRLAWFVRQFRERNSDSLVLLDPGDPWTKERPSGVAELFRIADVVLLNDKEFAQLAEGPPDSVSAIRRLRAVCPLAVMHVLKESERIRVVHPSGILLAEVRRATSSNAVDLTGAGDAVAAGFLAALCEQRTVVEGITLGLEIARLRVSAVGDRGHVDLWRRIDHPWELGPVRLGRSPRQVLKALVEAAPAVQAVMAALLATIAVISAVVTFLIGG